MSNVRMVSVFERKEWIIMEDASAPQARMMVKPDERIRLMSDRFTVLVWKDIFSKLRNKEGELFGKYVSARVEGDSERATMYANECAEVGRIIGLVTRKLRHSSHS